MLRRWVWPREGGASPGPTVPQERVLRYRHLGRGDQLRQKRSQAIEPDKLSVYGTGCSVLAGVVDGAF